MIIGFDISMLAYPGSGVATYTYNLIKNLLKIDKGNQYKLFYSSFRLSQQTRTQLTGLKKLGAKVYKYHLPHKFLNFIWNNHHFLPINWFIGSIDIFHSSDFFRPSLPKGVLGITTIHDFTWKVYPQYHPQNIIKSHEKKLEKTLKYHDLIVFISKKTKRDFEKFYPQAKNKTFILPEGVDKKFFKKYSSKKTKQVLKKYSITTPYLLYVGSIEPRKNIDKLVKSFKKISQKQSQLNLVLVGRTGLKSEQVFSLIKNLNLENKVKFIGLVSDKNLPLIFQGAKLLVYPSSYEGFGLPPLEALASKTPVVAYNCPSIPQTMDKKVTISKLVKDIDNKLQSPRLEKINIFSWQKTAKNFLKIINNIYET